MGKVTDTPQNSELAIVDLFTKLIFGGDIQFDESEQRILAALREVDAALVLDSNAEVGFYLRALGVRDMIALVSRVQERLSGPLVMSPAAPSAGSSHLALQGTS